MGTQIMEPNEIDAAEITDATAENFSVICYKKSQTGAGLHQLGFAPWKRFFNYNGFKVDNIAHLCGFTSDQYDKNYEIDPLPAEDTVVGKLQAIADNAGVSLTPSSSPSLNTRLTNAETTIGDSNSGLVKGVADNANEITNLWLAVGGEVSPGGQGLSQRVEAAEGNITDLQERVIGTEAEGFHDGLEYKVGDTTHGLIKDVNTLQSEVEDSSNGLLTRVTGIETTLNGEAPNKGLIEKVDTLNGTIYGTTGTDGLAGQVATNTSDISDLKTKISSAYKVKGDVTQAKATEWEDNDYAGYASMENGSVWNVNSQSAYTYVIFQIPVQPSDPSYPAEQITINNGENILWVKTESDPKYLYGYFDKLSTTVVDERIPTIEANVSDLQQTVDGTGHQDGLVDKVAQLESNTATVHIDNPGVETWSSSNETGMYVVTGLNSGSVLLAFIIFLNNGRLNTTTGIVPLVPSSNYTDLFTVDSTTYYMTTNPLAQRFNITKIGG